MVWRCGDGRGGAAVQTEAMMVGSWCETRTVSKEGGDECADVLGALRPGVACWVGAQGSYHDMGMWGEAAAHLPSAMGGFDPPPRKGL